MVFSRFTSLQNKMEQLKQQAEELREYTTNRWPAYDLELTSIGSALSELQQ
jgi:hypothetical protein